MRRTVLIVDDHEGVPAVGGGDSSMRLPTPIAVVLLALAALAGGCDFGGRGDKAGGSHAPLELRLAVASAADEADAPVARFFASRVAALSGGSIRVRVVFNAAGQDVGDTEVQVAREVHAGRFELGWIGSRAWDHLGVTSFQALQAPFLVTSYALLDRITTSPLAARMLAGLDGHGFVGLALVPDRLRHPIGVEHPLRSPAEFAGARVRVIPSRATDALMRALGATPVHVSGGDIDGAMARGEIDGTEHSLGGSWPGGHYLTANISFFARATTLFAGPRAYQRLDDNQRSALRKAAEQTVALVVAHPPNESALVRRYCDGGRVATASDGDLAALRRAAQPVYTALERDARTRALIAAIRALKATTPAQHIAAPDCALTSPTATARHLASSTLNGTYRWQLTKAGAIAVGDQDDPELDEADGSVNTMTLSDGKWLLQGGSTGTYEIVGNRIVFDWPQVASTLTFTLKRHANGDLDINPVLPMDPGDRWVWASAPWRRVGPPVRDIP
jgi:TRAP-type C4-dicarboxylate transport system substrate-binding protein